MHHTHNCDVALAAIWHSHAISLALLAKPGQVATLS